MKRRTGTREWSSHSVNIQTGCPHDCRYCYAASRMAECGIRDRDKWHLPQVRERDVRKGRKKLDGVIMFPTTHDITPENRRECMIVLKKLLEAGNQVLLVSKPHFGLVDELAHTVDQVDCRWRELLELRFTINCPDGERAVYWEPRAPRPGERFGELQRANMYGFRTSVSMEPCLMLSAAANLVKAFEPWVNETIWIGLMNQVRRRVAIETPEDERRVAEVEAEQTPERVRLVYEQLKDNPKVRWKDSIRKMLDGREWNELPARQGNL